ncbi:MAG: hypothetical protein ABSD98_01715 [Candidatus Korobacteraceae bacterium]
MRKQDAGASNKGLEKKNLRRCSISEPRAFLTKVDNAMKLAANLGRMMCLTALIFLACNACFGQEGTDQPAALGKWFTVSANLDGGWRKTQFFLPNYNTAVFDWDSRAELWLPPFGHVKTPDGKVVIKRIWGPYIRVAGIAGSEPQAWQNEWVGGPGLGLQAYPFPGFLGPVRMFAESNFTHYFNNDPQGTSWRPKNSTRAGFEYWKAVHVNDLEHYWWVEVWNGLYWQSANEFTTRYDSVLFANSGRVGIRKPKRGAISTITPYLAVESSLSKWRQLGNTNCHLSGQGSRDPQDLCDFFWENRFLAGGGLRFAPSLGEASHKGWLTRFVIYGEYLDTATYYGPTPPSQFPRYDVLVGVSANVGNWYK